MASGTSDILMCTRSEIDKLEIKKNSRYTGNKKRNLLKEKIGGTPLNIMTSDAILSFSMKYGIAPDKFVNVGYLSAKASRPVCMQESKFPYLFPRT